MVLNKEALMLFLKTLFLTFSLEGGMIPGYDVTMFVVPEKQTTLDIRRSWYSDMQCRLDIYKYFYIGGGITSYQWNIRSEANFYPFRLDYQLCAGVKYKNFELGYYNGCFHPIAPNTAIIPYGKIDTGHHRIFAKVKIKKQLF